MLASVRRVSPFSSQVRIAGLTPWDASLSIRTGYSTTSQSRLFSSTHAFQEQVMLSKAIQEHQPAPSAKQHSLSQALFPSSSPSSRPDLHGNGPRRKQPQSDRSAIPNAKPVLKPSASSVLNGSGIARTVGANTLLKRSLSQMKDSESAFSSYSSFHDLSRPDPFSTSQSQVSGSGQVASLHDAVYFDENDFDDDADLDLEVEDPMNKGCLSVSKPDVNLTVEQKTPLSNNRGINTSSAPLAWSSSPLQHKGTPPYAALLRRTNNLDAAEAEESRTAVNIDRVSEPRPTKRRTLPWSAESDNLVAQDGKTGPPEHVQKIIDRHRANRSQRPQHNGDFTRLSKDDQQSQYLWDKTASAMKEEQKKLRQANKRLVKSNDAIDDDMQQAVRAKKRQKLESVFLSQEQQRVLKLVVESGKSVFFTGSAGTGKSVLMREIIAGLRKKYAKELDRVAVTASTGLAACNIEGVTLHSFGGIGLGKEAVPELVKKVRRNQKAKNRWLRTRVLVVDEISMVDGDLFDKLEGIARAIRNNGRPFGGIQLVITGDFFQLPPVPDYGKVAKFAFDAATWDTSIEHTIGLTQIFRQKDPEFANMLNEMRLGRLSQKSINTFKSLSRPLSSKDDLHETELFPTRGEVDKANTMRMNNLVGTSRTFEAQDGGSIHDRSQRDKLLSNCMAPPVIELKKGAQVMLIKNMDDSLVNGSLGTVVAFMDENAFDRYHEDEEAFQASETMDINEENMSRARKKLKAMMNKDGVADTGKKWPLVNFAKSDGTFRQLLCQPEVWKIELPNGEVQASRSQIPLILAWALSIHKAQGQTLDRVKVDLGKIFEKGQAYVALSRATRQEGLQVLRFDPKKVMAHDRVRDFYSKLYSAEQAVTQKPQAEVPSYGTKSAREYEKSLLLGDIGTGLVAQNSIADDSSFEDDEELFMSAHY